MNVITTVLSSSVRLPSEFRRIWPIFVVCAVSTDNSHSIHMWMFVYMCIIWLLACTWTRWPYSSRLTSTTLTLTVYWVKFRQNCPLSEDGWCSERKVNEIKFEWLIRHLIYFTHYILSFVWLHVCSLLIPYVWVRELPLWLKLYDCRWLIHINVLKAIESVRGQWHLESTISVGREYCVSNIWRIVNDTEGCRPVTQTEREINKKEAKGAKHYYFVIAYN